jgi:hypothetical protein
MILLAYINLALTTKLARLQALNAAIGGNATVVIHDGFYPATPDEPALANALATFACDPLAFGNVAVQMSSIGNAVVAAALLVSNPFPPVLCSANGNAAWARISDATGQAVVDLDVALASGNVAASIVMNATDLLADVPVQIVSITLTEQ